ncbi:carbonic anhydrase family protein [Thalassomonas viridans]|uniref:Carbonic anhydrase n=1 Tax=Thalassomonas viridans TaxID=137584 RepID=A0AAF0CCZ2_9GAMM|nr:carbonic anhydrase family protein [Thalassomonas viridans]WDE08773.1 carbonic anhydrase family protein [Thalassomonas viridans]
MKIRNIALFVLLSGAATAALAGAPHWEYKGKHGAEHWGDLTSAFSTCKNGVNQSPIDISSTIDANLPALDIRYQASNVSLLNNGHTIQANIAGKNTFKNDAGQFDLKQFHFHSPSENTVNGKSYPLEMHFVHSDESGNLAVIGVMFEQGNENQALAGLWQDMPAEKHKPVPLAGRFESKQLLPKNKDYFRFNGSLTTPPCSEGVRWFVMQEPLQASSTQIEKFRSVMPGDTNRPVQSVNARVVLR